MLFFLFHDKYTLPTDSQLFLSHFIVIKKKIKLKTAKKFKCISQIINTYTKKCKII